MVEVGVCVTQTGFVVAIVYFISSQSLHIIDFASQMNGSEPLDESARWVFLPICFVLLMPMLMVHKVSRFARLHVFGNVLLILTMLAVMYYAVESVMVNGCLNEDLPRFNREKWPNSFGVAIFVFEGVALVLPVQDMTASKEDYFRIVCIVNCLIGALYLVFCELSLNAWYSRFQDDKPLITEYLPKDRYVCQLIILIFNVNLLITYVLFIYPVNKVLDRWFLSGMEAGPKKRALKNLSRALLLLFTIVVALCVWSRVNTFLAITGAFSCAPILLVLPALFHLRVCAETGRQKLIDIGLACFGLIVMVFCTSFAILTW